MSRCLKHANRKTYDAANAAIRTGQCVLAILVAALSGVDLGRWSRSGRHADSRWIYAQVVSVLSTLTALACGFRQRRAPPSTASLVFCVLCQALLSLLWVVASAVYGQLVVSEAAATELDFTRSAVEMAVAASSISAVLWFVDAVAACACRKGSEAQKADAEEQQGGQGLEGNSGVGTRPSQPVPLYTQPNLQLAELGVDDLALLHHYHTVTAPTLGDARLWRDAAPRLGREHPCIFHIMLSISAYHVVRLRGPATTTTTTSAADCRLRLAEHHYEAAVRLAVPMLPRLDVGNCQALYIVTVLICFTAFARGPSSEGDLLLVAQQQGLVPWMSLLRGVRFVIETVGSSTVFSGFLTPVPETTPDEASCRGGGAKIYERAIESLTRCFETTFGEEKEEEEEKEDAAVPKKCTHGQVHVVMAWAYTLDPDFVAKLAERDHVSLVLLGHFAILVQTLGRYWFIEGWGEHILRQVRQILGEDWNDLLP
ncbi:hypothetical protein NHJ13734_003115 [Beauveria thailandica]